MSGLEGLSTPDLLLSFLVLRVTDQSFSSDLPLTTSLGKVSGEIRFGESECRVQRTMGLNRGRGQQQAREEVHLDFWIVCFGRDAMERSPWRLVPLYPSGPRLRLGSLNCNSGDIVMLICFPRSGWNVTSRLSEHPKRMFQGYCRAYSPPCG